MQQINLTGLQSAPPKKKTGKTYPFLPDEDGSMAAKVDELRPILEEIQKLDGKAKRLKAELVEEARNFYFAYSHGKTEVPSSIEVKGTNGNVLVAFQQRYKQLEPDDPRIAVIGELLGEKAKEALMSSFSIKIDGDRLAVLPVTEQQDIIDQIATLMDCHEVPDAVQAESVVRVSPEFHTKRHRIIEPAMNVEFDDVLPATKAVKRR